MAKKEQGLLGGDAWTRLGSNPLTAAVDAIGVGGVNLGMLHPLRALTETGSGVYRDLGAGRLPTRPLRAEVQPSGKVSTSDPLEAGLAASIAELLQLAMPVGGSGAAVAAPMAAATKAAKAKSLLQSMPQAPAKTSAAPKPIVVADDTEKALMLIQAALEGKPEPNVIVQAKSQVKAPAAAAAAPAYVPPHAGALQMKSSGHPGDFFFQYNGQPIAEVTKLEGNKFHVALAGKDSPGVVVGPSQVQETAFQLYTDSLKPKVQPQAAAGGPAPFDSSAALSHALSGNPLAAYDYLQGLKKNNPQGLGQLFDAATPDEKKLLQAAWNTKGKSWDWSPGQSTVTSPAGLASATMAELFPGAKLGGWANKPFEEFAKMATEIPDPTSSLSAMYGTQTAGEMLQYIKSLHPNFAPAPLSEYAVQSALAKNPGASIVDIASAKPKSTPWQPGTQAPGISPQALAQELGVDPASVAWMEGQRIAPTPSGQGYVLGDPTGKTGPTQYIGNRPNSLVPDAPPAVDAATLAHWREISPYTTPAYRGSGQPPSQYVRSSHGKEYFSTASPDLANLYAQTYSSGQYYVAGVNRRSQNQPLLLDTRNYLDYDAGGAGWSDAQAASFPKARKEGRAGVIMRNVYDEPDSTKSLPPQTVYVTFPEGKNTVRSRFAQFNPARYGENDLLAGLAGGGIILVDHLGRPYVLNGGNDGSL